MDSILPISKDEKPKENRETLDTERYVDERETGKKQKERDGNTEKEEEAESETVINAVQATNDSSEKSEVKTNEETQTTVNTDGEHDVVKEEQKRAKVETNAEYCGTAEREEKEPVCVAMEQTEREDNTCKELSESGRKEMDVSSEYDNHSNNDCLGIGKRKSDVQGLDDNKREAKRQRGNEGEVLPPLDRHESRVDECKLSEERKEDRQDEGKQEDNIKPRSFLSWLNSFRTVGKNETIDSGVASEERDQELEEEEEEEPSYQSEVEKLEEEDRERQRRKERFRQISLRALHTTLGNLQVKKKRKSRRRREIRDRSIEGIN